MKGVKHLKVPLDEVTNIPADILSFILSLLTIKEAARTSILSRRWRYIWKTSVASSLSLYLDVLKMKSCDECDNEFDDCIAGRNYYCTYEPSRRPGSKKHKFVGYIYQILHLDHSSVKDSFRLRFYLKKDFARLNDQWIDMATTETKDIAHHIDQWIKMAIAQRCQSRYTDLSHLVIRREIYHDGNLYYQFPCLFSTQEIGSSEKCTSFNSNGYSSLLDLRLKKVLVDRNAIVSILSNCPNLEKLCLWSCKGMLSLEVSGPSLKLKCLTIMFCDDWKNIVINATNLTRFRYHGNPVKFMHMNVPQLSTVSLRTECDNSYGALSYARGKLSSDFPELKSLILSATLMKESKIPKQSPLFSKLMKLVLLVQTYGGTLWGFIPLLQASPYLQRLELHLALWTWDSTEEDLMERPSDFPLLHLEEIILSGLSGCSHEIEFATYLLNNATTLKKLSIFTKQLLYEFATNTLVNRRETESEKITRKENKNTWKQLEKYVRPGVKYCLPK